jgi:hypothetical protein
MKDYDNLYAVKHLFLPPGTAPAVDFGNYTAYVSSLSKQIDPDTVSLDTLEAMLALAEATGNLLDLYKKTIVYGRKDLKTAMLAANTELRRANIVLDDALCLDGESRGMPEGNKAKLNFELLHAAIGAFGEWAEVLSALRRSVNTGKLDVINVIEEIGDASYYDAAAHVALKVPKHTTMGRNKAKLDIRFPEGKFTQERVNRRDLGAERVALEGASPL